MAEKNLYAGVKHVTYISSNIGRTCEHCTTFGWVGMEKVAESINHYIQDHGYRLLHVGAETSRDLEGNPAHHTVAVLGKS